MRSIKWNIIHDSWPRMEKGELGLKVGPQIDELYNYISAFESKDLEQKVIKERLTKNLDKASDLRKSRNMSAIEGMVPHLMWLVIICCSFISISTGFFFDIKPIWVHIILEVFHSGMIIVVIFLILSMMYPYRGGMKITPEAFQFLLKTSYPAIDKEYAQFLQKR